MELQQDIIDLAAQLGAILTDKSLWITTAESCTGGGISYVITDTPGSSAYLDRAFVTYSNTAKNELLNVGETTLQVHGAVSEQTVMEMAQGACIAANADIAISVSGIAGPGGATETKPVGTVWFCIRYLDENYTYCEIFPGERAEVRLQVIVFALKKLIKHINF
ncbi:MULTISPECIES: CinA family protein [unclassified Pseudoalteromonas]|uniref:CinA family protein n=1 Tax=unclassified Pseudoalteromonas TaxID=194690 RepID=UPI0005A69790|nr:MULTISPECIES: nicotinamide-nucleotide amidohydrolase family protein [unclassified Pseudoalteromonas]